MAEYLLSPSSDEALCHRGDRYTPMNLADAIKLRDWAEAQVKRLTPQTKPEGATIYRQPGADVKEWTLDMGEDEPSTTWPSIERAQQYAACREVENVTILLSAKDYRVVVGEANDTGYSDGFKDGRDV